MKKNDIIQTDITDMSVDGLGIGRASDFTFFIKGAVTGDRVSAVITRMNKNYGYAKTLEILEPSPDRISPPCPRSSRCGGCQLMEMSYPAQLAFKEAKVRNDLERIGGQSDFLLQPIIGMQAADPGCNEDAMHRCIPLHFRNKMQYPVGTDKDGNIVCGFYAGRTHYIVEGSDCPVSKTDADKVLVKIKDFLTKHNISAYDETTGCGIVRHILIRSAKDRSMMVCLVINAPSLPDNANDLLVRELRDEFPNISSICLNINKKKTNVILGTETKCLFGNDYIEDTIKDLKFRISALSFFQVNPVQTERLYDKVLEFADLTGKEYVWDLYCGAGTISLFLAKKAARVCGVEIVAPAIENAKLNAQLNGIKNVSFFCGPSETVFPQMVLSDKGMRSDIVVLAPPRKGCDMALLDAILSVLPEKIIYVSCNSSTLARDIKILTQGGCYKLIKAAPVDMFPHTVHVETVVLMSRGKE